MMITTISNYDNNDNDDSGGGGGGGDDDDDGYFRFLHQNNNFQTNISPLPPFP